MTNSHTMHTAAQPDADWFSQSPMFNATRMAMMMWQVPMPMAPMVRTGLRPALSIQRTAGMVATNMTMPTTPVARRELVLRSRPRSSKMNGA